MLTHGMVLSYLFAYAYVVVGLIGKYNLAREIPKHFR